MIDIEQNGMETAPRFALVETDFRVACEGEEVAVHKATTRISGDAQAERSETAAMPLDDFGQSFHDNEAAERRVFECRVSRVPEAEAADHDIEISALLNCEA